MDDLISRQAAIDDLREYKVEPSHFCDESEIECFNDGIDTAISVLATLPSAERRGRWIPVTERLPEEEGQYLVSCDTDYGVEVGRFYIDEDGERYFGCDWNDPDDIEAWMPLPEPYKGGEGE